MRHARRRRKKSRRNPFDAVDYWLLLGGVVVVGVAIWGYKNMSAAAKAKALST